MMLATSKVSYIEELARELCANPLFDTEITDVYDSHDWYENYVSEMTETLWDDDRRNGLIADLKGMIEECENDEQATELYQLYVKVKEV